MSYITYESEIINIKNLLKLEIDARKEAIKIIDLIKPIIKESDGKRADKRFIDKLQKVYSGLNIKHDESIYNRCDINIKMYVKNRCCKSCDAEHYIYIKNDVIYLTNNHDYKSYLDYKINASEILLSLEKEQTRLINCVNALSEQRKNLKNINKKWLKLVNNLRAYRDSINYTIADYLKMYEANI